MRHLDDGTLRRLLDEPFSTPASERSHFASCARCRERAASMSTDAASVGSVLSALPVGELDPPAASARLVRTAGASAPLSIRERFDRFYEQRGGSLSVPVAAGLAAAAVIVLLAFTPVGTFAQNFLTIFEPRQFVAINVSRGQLEYLPDLRSFGTMVQRGEPAHRETATAAQAAAVAGIPVRLPAFVPAGVPGPVHYIAVGRSSASFTFSAAKTRAYGAAAHKTIPPMPARLDGSVLTLRVGPMVVIDYGKLPQEQAARSRGGADEAPDRGEMPSLAIVESAAPQLYSTGATARELENYLLQMPGVPPQLADEIRAIGDPSTTMPIPVPIDKAYSQRVIVDGTSGLAVGDNTGVGGIVLWQKNGIVYGVGGALPQRELMEIAQSLR